MSTSSTNKVLGAVVTGLSRLDRVKTLELRQECTGGGFHTRVTLSLDAPNPYGGQASLSLDLTLPNGDEGLLGYFHLVNLTVANLMDSLSSSLNAALLELTDSTPNTSVSILLNEGNSNTYALKSGSGQLVNEVCSPKPTSPLDETI